MKKLAIICLGLVFTLLISACMQTQKNRLVSSQEQMLLVLAAPAANNEYYQDYFEEIINFQINYANKVLGNDQIRILVDADTRQYFLGRVPDEILLEADMHDIWIRDFAMVNPKQPVQFVYTNASMSWEESEITQEAFDRFANEYQLERKRSDYILDGGNLVDNYQGKIVTTTRFLEDNDLTYKQGKAVLKELLGANQVAIIEPDDDVLAHADGMVAWIDDNVLLVNDYTKIDRELHEKVMTELSSSFPDSKILTVPVEFDDNNQIDDAQGIGSACGINLNLVATFNTLYVPVFGTDYEADVLEIIANNTSKKVVEIDAKYICLFGGSVRCTTWQLAGVNLEREH